MRARSIFLIILFGLLHLSAFAEDKGVFRAVIVSDTITKSTKISCKKDIRLLEPCLQAISRQIGYSLQLSPPSTNSWKLTVHLLRAKQSFPDLRVSSLKLRG